jgi:flagellar motor component MotA
MANQPPANRNNPPVSEETLRELLSVQKQELTVRFEELQRDKAEISLNQSLAQQSIDAQERDRKHEREEVTKRQKTHQNFVLFVVFLILAFSGGAMWMGQSALVLDLSKVIVGFVGGMGYFAWRNNKRSDVEQA